MPPLPVTTGKLSANVDAQRLEAGPKYFFGAMKMQTAGCTVDYVWKPI